MFPTKDRLIRHACGLGVVATLLACGVASHAGDWPRFRGPNADGTSSETGLFRKGGDFGLTLAWKKTLGSGYSGIAVSKGTLVTMFSNESSDLMVAFDPKTGNEKWRFEIASTYAGHDGSHGGPLSTPLIDSGRVFGLGPHGKLFAVELKSGKPLWSSDLVAERGSRPPFYGFSTSPIIQDDVLVVQIGSEEGSVAGFDPETGELLWKAGNDAVMHQSPIPFRFQGRRQVVLAGNTNLTGLDPRTGDVLWEYPHGGSGPRGVWSMMPVPAGEGRLFLAHQDEASSMVQLELNDDTVVAKKLWEESSIKNSYNVPIYHDGHLYAFSTRILTCVDADTGKIVWRSREPGDGFMVLVDGHLVIVTKKGALHIANATPDGYHEVASLQLFDDLAWTEASIADGSFYVRSLSELARVDIALGGRATAASRADEMLGTAFPAFLAKAAMAGGDQRKKVVDEFLGGHSSFPIVEDEVAHFIYRGPGEDLAVAGDMIGARQERSMSRLDGTDLFYFSMRLEPDARVNYMFMRDYEAIVDPLNPRRTASIVLTRDMDLNFSGEETEMSWFSMPEWKAPSFLGEPDADRRGRVETHELESKALEASHSVDVYLPAGYDDSEESYAVAYVHGGAAAQERGRVPTSLDNLVGKSVAPVIVVFIGTQPPPFGSPVPYAQMVVGELVPFIDSTYRTIAEPRGRASLGNGTFGFPTFLCALMQPGIFGKVGTQSPLMFDFALVALQPMLKEAADQPLDIYMDWGTYDLRSEDERWNMGERSRDFAALLGEKGYAPAGGEVADGTGWSSWSNRTDALFGALFPMEP